MKIQKLHLATLGVIVVLVIIIIIATTVPQSRTSSMLILPEDLDPSQCPSEYSSPRPVILVSLDGFRSEYLHRNRTPTLLHLSERGVHAPYLLPVYPTKTFPNHYSIVTGLYPESHGIVANVFYSPAFKALFTIGSAPARNGSWWDGEPIWNTLDRQGKRSATFFWPGSEADIGGRHPSEWFTYNSSVSYRQRVNQVLTWVSLPPEKRPAWVSLYLEEPDKQGHATGPLSAEVDKKIEKVEETVRWLVSGLAERQLLNCVNILFVSDHGMAQAKDHADIDLATSVPNIDQIANVIFGASAQVILKDPTLEAEVDLITHLDSSFKGKLRAFRKLDLPKRLHYANNPRIGSIVLLVSPGYTVKDVRPGKKQRPPLKGIHGYDNIHSDMAGFFIGYGPDLVQGKTVDPFQNIELYNLMCLLVGVEPAPNNGTWGALHHLLAAPPPLPNLLQLDSPKPLNDAVKAGDKYHLAEGCEADSKWTGRQKPLTQESANDTLQHIPWGPPTTSRVVATPVLLLHHTHVTGYSQELKLPLWTSFTIHDSNQTTGELSKIPWLADHRLHPTEAATCTEYEALKNISMAPLFPPRYGAPEVPEEAYFISNAIGIADQGQGEGTFQRWQALTHEQLAGWLQLHAPLNVVLGPVFDYDDNGHFDQLNKTGSVHVPSDLFAVMTRCKDKVTSLTSCDPARLDSLAFIYPQTQYSWTSASGGSTSYAMHYTARVRDVELLTNLTFFPNLAANHRLAQVLRMHRSLWRLP